MLVESNFLFLKHISIDLFESINKAEQYYISDREVYVILLRRFVETIVNQIINREGLSDTLLNADLHQKIQYLYEDYALVSKSFSDKCHRIRTIGNDIIHSNYKKLTIVPIDDVFEIAVEYTKKYHSRIDIPPFNKKVYLKRNYNIYQDIQNGDDKSLRQTVQSKQSLNAEIDKSNTNEAVHTIKQEKKQKELLKDNSQNDTSKKYTDENSSEYERVIKSDSEINTLINDGEYEAVTTRTSKQDASFVIINLKDAQSCSHQNAAVYALIFSMIHNRDIVNGDYDEIFQKIKHINHENYDYKFVYIMINLILLMIKHNEITEDNIINLQLIEWPGHYLDVENACKIINEMSEKICTISNRYYSPIIVRNDISSGRKIKIYESLSGKIEKDSVGIVNLQNNNVNKIVASTWQENNIIFSVDIKSKEHADIMKFFLKQFMGYSEFRDGQLEVIASILNNNSHKLCIMPTGSGKSLIFYYIALMRSASVFVVSPTELLIRDQIRNLKDRHDWDSVEVINSATDFSNYCPNSKLVYLTSEIFLNRDLILRLIKLNYYNKISHIVLDEVHCISNWSHDFRPDYLMLSFLLREFVDKTTYIGFTATANYAVVKDIMRQLEMIPNQILLPIQLKNDNVEYSFVDCSNDEIVNRASSEFDRLLNQNSKVICFTKSYEVSKKLKSKTSEDSKLKTDIFDGAVSSYYEFVSGEIKGLVCDAGMGIGINLPDVNDVVHVGAPLSKNHFVQEIGRASRTQKRKAGSYVFYSSIKNNNAKEKTIFFDSNTDVSDIVKAVKTDQPDTDIYLSYRHILGHLDVKEHFLSVVLELFKDIYDLTNSRQIIKAYINESHRIALMRGLYVLFRIGVIFAWYIVNDLDSSYGHSIEFHITTKEFNLEEVKERSIKYLRSLGRYNKYVSEIKESKSIENVIKIFVEWYYQEFFYQQREHALQVLEFFDHYKNRNSNEINEHLMSFYSLNLLEISKTTIQIDQLNVREILNLVKEELSEITVESIRKSMESEYSAKCDLFLFAHYLINNKSNDMTRFNRIVSNLGHSDQLDLLSFIVEFYNQMDYKCKIETINILSSTLGFERVINSIYSKHEQDDAFTIMWVFVFNKYWEMPYVY